MKKLVILLLGLTIAFNCSKKAPEPTYEPGSMEYHFFTIISDSLGIPDLNPKHSVPLVETKALTVYSSEIMEEVYNVLKPYTVNKKQPTREQVINLYQGAARNRAGHRLLLTTAKVNSISISEEEVSVEFQKVKENVGGEQEFLKRLHQKNKTVEDIKQQIREFSIINQFLDEIYYTRVQVDNDIIQSLCNEYKTATVRHILFLTQNKTPAEKKEIHKKAENILARAKAGEDFSQLAETYSEDPGSKENGGLYENFAKGAMVKPFEEASFNFPIGSISNLVETQYGYHIINVIRRKRDERPLDEVKKEIHVGIAKKQEPDLVRSVIEELKEKYGYKELFSDAQE